jgi:hypothetical protein
MPIFFTAKRRVKYSMIAVKIHVTVELHKRFCSMFAILVTEKPVDTKNYQFCLSVIGSWIFAKLTLFHWN